MSTTRSTSYIFLKFFKFFREIFFLCSFLSLIWGYDDPLVFSNNFYKLKTFNYPNSNFKSLEDFTSLNAVFLTRNDIKKKY